MARTVQEIQEQQNILVQQQAELKRQLAVETSNGKNFDALLAQRTELRNQEAALRTELAKTTNQSPATGVYQGQDPNTGLATYTNPATGATFKSTTEPTAAQAEAFKTTQTPATATTPIAPASDPVAPSPLSPPAAIPVDTLKPLTPEQVTSPPPIPTVTAGTEVDPAAVDPATVPAAANASSSYTGAPAAVDLSPVPATANASSGYYTKSPPAEDPPLLTPAESIAKAQKQPEVVDPTVAAANFNAATNQGILSAIAPASQNESAAESARLARSGNRGATSAPSSTNLPPEIKFSKAEDWRVRLTLAPGSKYFYNAEKPGILEPLIATNGVIFPYSPTIQMAYKANYDTTEVTHSNYKLHFYKNSSVEDITITAEFTAQDTVEANYLLAVMHFFKTATKMFYGQDVEPKPGTPPPLLYLSGFGAYQYDNHPLVLTSFSYTLPNDVDYIRAGVSETWAGSSISTLSGSTDGKAPTNPVTGFINRIFRIKGNGLQPGGQKPAPTFNKTLSNNQATYIPSKLQISLTLHPMVTRRDISQNFSLQKYATGELLQGSNRQGGGIW